MDIKRIGIGMVFGFCIIWSCFFVIYGAVQLYTRSERIEILEAWKTQTNVLELKVEEYERITKALPVLRQLITPVGWLELEARAESNRQEKIRNAKK